MRILNCASRQTSFSIAQELRNWMPAWPKAPRAVGPWLVPFSVNKHSNWLLVKFKTVPPLLVSYVKTYHAASGAQKQNPQRKLEAACSNQTPSSLEKAWSRANFQGENPQTATVRSNEARGTRHGRQK